MSDVAVVGVLTDAQVQARLQQAVNLLNQQQVVAAEAALASVLVDRPENADGLQLMGTLRHMQGRMEEAEKFYRRAIAANPELPQAHFNLGNLLRGLGLFDEAVSSFREALRLKPNYAEAHVNLGLSLQSLGQPEAAEKALREGLRMQPNWLMLKQALSGVLNDLNRPEEAERVLRGALPLSEREPRQAAALLHNLGVSLKLQRRYPEALQALDEAQRIVPEMPTADYNRGNVLQNMGRLEEAVEMYRRALSRQPLNLLAHRDLNHLLYRLERDDELLRSYDDVILLYPEVGQLTLDKAQFLFFLGKYDEAREHFERAASLLPGNVMPHDGLGLIFARTGQFDAAIREHEVALKMEPDNAHAWVNFSETLIRAGDALKAVRAAERARAIAPEDQHALAMWGLALRAMGDARDEWLNDYEEFVQVFELDPPEGYSDMESFNRDLNVYLNQLHSDRRENIDQTLRGGTQTVENIFGAGHDPVERLRAQIDKAVAAYIGRMKEEA
ncbi:MAG: tetratricopeptide repeat protein, partial [Sinobacteraceae bacterium]|nr:tetratricopeptide repeat protein [Nevskiaceae bacterium]